MRDNRPFQAPLRSRSAALGPVERLGPRSPLDMSPKKRRPDGAAHRVNPEALADALVARLAPVIPEDWSLAADTTSVVLTDPDGRQYGLTTDLQGGLGPSPQRLLGLAEDMLATFQSEIAEATTEPWPARSGEQYRGFPEPAVEILGDALHMRYGDGPSLALTLEPIQLCDIFSAPD